MLQNAPHRNLMLLFFLQREKQFVFPVKPSTQRGVLTKAAAAVEVSTQISIFELST